MANNWILIIDDNEADRDLLVRLEKHLPKRFKMVGTDNAISGLALLESTSERPHLILLDLKLPRLTGVEFLRGIRNDNRFKQVPVVMVSGFGTKEVEKECFAAGCDQFVYKEIDFDVYVSHLLEASLPFLSEDDQIHHAA